MKINIEITPNATLTENDFRAMREQAAQEGITPDEWSANAIRRALLKPKPGTRHRHEQTDAEAA